MVIRSTEDTILESAFLFLRWILVSDDMFEEQDETRVWEDKTQVRKSAYAGLDADSKAG